jgi:putative copper export protein
MWFSEDLNKTFTTAYVVNASDTAAQVLNNPSSHVDSGDAHIAAGNTKEMDVSLKSGLEPAVYSVIYRTQSLDDGHILNGSFVFTIANTDGSLPGSSGSALSSSSLGGATTTGQLDGATLFGAIAVTLVDLGAVFWVGAQFIRVFMLHMITERDDEQRMILQRMERRFDYVFSLPLLLLILVANVGVLVGQAMNLVSGSFFQAFSPTLLMGFVSQGQFGTFWLVRQVAVLLALVLAVVLLWREKKQTGEPVMSENLAWVNFILGLGLLCAITLSGHASAVNSNLIVPSVLYDLLHLIAASLWVGGMLYLSLAYLPVLDNYPPLVRTRSMLTVFRRFSPLAYTGVVFMALTGPLNATVRLDSWTQLITTTYGWILLSKSMLVCLMLLVSAYHVFFLRPRLAKEYQNYQDTRATPSDEGEASAEDEKAKLLTTADSKKVEQQVAQRSKYLSNVVRWEPTLGVLVLLCTGLLGVFSSTLQNTTTTTTAPAPPQPRLVVSKPYTSTIETTDKQYKITLTIDPNRFGNNTFTTVVHDSHGAVVNPNNIGVSLYVTMLDMDMGTQEINLQPDKKGNFSAQDALSMEGHWEFRVSIRTLDDKLHDATVDVTTPTPVNGASSGPSASGS